jgi:predicted lipid-binding transport protein (Tim44 family)
MKKNRPESVLNEIDTKKLSPLDVDLMKIPNFNKDVFIKGAQKAFELILNAFSKGDLKKLALLVNKDLLKKFEEVIDFRKQNGIEAETDLIGFVKTEVESVSFVDDNVVNVVVNFVSEQVNLLKNSDGDVIEGDENYIQTINDVWTFERNLKSSDNNWLLCSTKKC